MSSLDPRTCVDSHFGAARAIKIPTLGVWSDEWDENEAEGRKRRLPSGGQLGITLYELSHGGGIAYHFHHSREELLVVLRGTLTLRTPAGVREVNEGEVVLFPAGPDGAHGITKEGDEPARYLMVSTLVPGDASEYPPT
jgi:uncharacterized cupin superfamily protein